MFTDNQILEIIKNKGFITTSQLAHTSQVSRAYAHKTLKKLVDAGKIKQIGKTNQSRYVLSEQKESVLYFQREYQNTQLAEDIVLKEIKLETSILSNIGENVSHIIDYAFTEMLNNAIDHSQSEKIHVSISKDDKQIVFVIRDYGIGIFANIMKKKKLSTELEGLQELTKGKQTTDPKHHSGEGIFFTSRLADEFVISSHKHQMRMAPELLITKKRRELKGTKVIFTLSLDNQKKIKDVFDEYTGKDFTFDKTQIPVKIFQLPNKHYISRSEAKRMMEGLDAFNRIILDFNQVETIGQGFADQIFRVWKDAHPKISIEPVNANDIVSFMIQRVKRR